MFSSSQDQIQGEKEEEEKKSKQNITYPSRILCLQARLAYQSGLPPGAGNASGFLGRLDGAKRLGGPRYMTV